MNFRFRHLSVTRKLLIVTFLTIAVAFSAMTSFVFQRTQTAMTGQAEIELQQNLTLLNAAFEIFDQNVTQATESLSNVFVAMFPQGIRLDTNRTVRVGSHDAPAALHGDKLINGDFSMPDEFTRVTGGNATVFVRSGDDFLRVSTSLKKQDGSRATGTMLGKHHPGYPKLMSGRPYLGKAHLFGRDYMTKYQPVRDDKGSVIAVLYVGFDFTETLAGLKRHMTDIRVGEHGMAFLADAQQGDDYGKLLVHRTQAGGSLLDIVDTDGNAVFSEALGQSEGLVHYATSSEESGDQVRITAYKHVDNWNLMIGIDAVESEITELGRQMSSQLLALMIIGAVLILAVLFVALRHELSPLKRISDVLMKVAEGDLSERLLDEQQARELKTSGDRSSNEIVQLNGSINNMIVRVRELLGDIRDVSLPLHESANELAAQTEETHSKLRDQQERTDQVAAATTEMTASIQEVAGSVSSAGESTQHANDRAQQGRTKVTQVETAIKTVAGSIAQATDVISGLKDESENIGSVLDVIRGIADQTNLLALNAAIEAARAGEQGRGFAVVADEVRNLAQRTQQSTKEIESMIDRLQSQATTAVAHMATSHDRSHDSVEQAVDAAGELQAIEDSANSISGMIMQVASAAEEQSVVAEEINGNIVGIRDLSEQTASQARKTAKSSERLAELATRLTGSIERFRL